LQEHLKVGLVQKVFLCVRGGDESLLPSWAWPAHEIYFTLVILIIPWVFMTAAYGAIGMYQSRERLRDLQSKVA
jgi:hypothetical protein